MTESSSFLEAAKGGVDGEGVLDVLMCCILEASSSESAPDSLEILGWMSANLDFLCSLPA